MAATGQPLTIQGIMTIPITIKSITLVTSVLIADELPHAVLIGVDELVKNQFVLDFGKKLLYTALDHNW